MCETLEFNASEITPAFQAAINEQIKKCWIGRGYPGSSRPRSSYDESVLVISGEIPFLITAPHAVPHDRGQMTLKPQDNNTDVIVLETCKNLNCHGLIPLKPLADPNSLYTPVRRFNRPKWHDTKLVPFFLEATKLIQEKGIEFGLDVHGMVDGFKHSVVIGDGGAKGKAACAEGLKRWLNRNGIKSAINSTELSAGGTWWFDGGDLVRQISIPALQLEVGRAYRTYEQIQKLSRLLTEFLERTCKIKSKEFLRSHGGLDRPKSLK